MAESVPVLSSAVSITVCDGNSRHSLSRTLIKVADFFLVGMLNFLSLIKKYNCCWHFLMMCVLRPGEILADVNAEELKGFHLLYLQLTLVVCATPHSSLGQ